MIVATVGSLLGKSAAAWHAPEFGLSNADRLVVTFRDGSAAFVKGATTEETAGWLRNEHRILDHLRGTSLSPEVLGWQDDGTGQPLLVTEDLSAAYWPAAGVENPGGGTSTVWRPGDIDVLRRTLDRLRLAPLPAGLPRTASWPGPQWPRVIELADQLVDVGVVIRGWLEANAETLIARLAGPSLQRACVSEQPEWLRRVFISLASINLTWLAVTLGLPLPVPDQHTRG